MCYLATTLIGKCTNIVTYIIDIQGSSVDIRGQAIPGELVSINSLILRLLVDFLKLILSKNLFI